MGLIRKTLAVGTLGVVHGSSKKQRVAKATLQALEAQRIAALKDEIREHEFRCATDPVYLAWVRKQNGYDETTQSGLED